jgi:glycosyltransferase involved in cell wall biosynthesis
VRIGLILPGFSASETDWAIPVQLNLVRALAADHRVRVVALRYPHARQPYDVFGAEVFPLGVGQIRGLGRLRLWTDALRLLRRLHRVEPFDVLHAMWTDESGLLAAWAGRLLGVPVVVSVAGGELARLEDIGYGLQRSAFSRWMVGQALHGADRVIVYSGYAQRLVKTAGYRVPAGRLRMVPLGVDPAVFCPGDTPRAARRLLHVGSLVPVKDQATLLRAVARLPGDVTLDIAGEGPLWTELLALADDLGIAKRVHFLGTVDHLALPDLYRQATLHVFSSRHEALLMALLEAAACGLPSVGTAVGLLPDRTDLGSAVPVGDADALARAILSLLDDPARRASLGRAAHRAVLDRYTVEHAAAALAALYAELA